MRKSIQILVFAALLFFTGCKEKEIENPDWKTTPYAIEIPPYFPTILNIPSDNPLTVEGVSLGRFLFYDGRLSGRTHPDSLMTCGNCHIRDNNFRAGLYNENAEEGIPIGIKGIKTIHATLPLVNLVWNQNGYTWNGSVHSSTNVSGRGNLEDIVLATITHPAELAGDTAKTAALFQSIIGYPELFYKAFGSNKVTADRISKAIAQFVRTLISADSRFDKYMRGELQLSEDELAGFVLFTTEEGGDCFHCHGSSGNPLFTTNLFYNNGKDTIFNTLDDRFIVTGDSSDIGCYKATTLRNISTGGPYMHDGRFKTLDEVIDFYSHNILMSDYIDPLMHHVATNGIQLTPIEKLQLKAFLQSLTDEEFLNNPVLGPPATFPDGKSYDEVK
ncbi:MAG TPA: cytochrome c peroxidase [Lentimicrobium sp.]|nr:cytochrome c peroxidase [Lentimicrobium sp.]